MAINTPSTASLEQFQTQEQRYVLDTVAQIRKCGLDGVLSLPQLVVCGDQSAGKSSVLEALTEIPIPRNDNLCTRFATEFTLRRAATDNLILRIIPDNNRAAHEKASISEFNESISDFAELPSIMDKAMRAMGLDGESLASNPRAFARDILSIEIEGPTRPQLTLVDVPGLIQTDTKGVTKNDLEIVNEITDFYIQQNRTICLAVVSATNDYANQPILTKVRDADPDGNRTLGIITKPDRLEHGSGSEGAFIDLARNEDIFFKLGWHVIKNRNFDEAACSIEERNASEAAYFRRSNFSVLPQDCIGIDALRARLSALIFDHTKRELPNLRKDLDEALEDNIAQLTALGMTRSSVGDCRNYLTTLSLTCLEITQAAVAGHYEREYFQHSVDANFSIASPVSVRRFRAAVQFLNRSFAEIVRKQGPKYYIAGHQLKSESAQSLPSPKSNTPIHLTREEALEWVGRVLMRCRGREPVGNYNPLIIGELFWEQSSGWKRLADEHLERISGICRVFLDSLLSEKCPGDVRSRLMVSVFVDALKMRRSQAIGELEKLMTDNSDFPAIYNHYYTDTVQKYRGDRMKDTLASCVSQATSHEHLPGCNSTHTSAKVDPAVVADKFQASINRDMERFSCEEALDHLLSMYKVSAVYNTNTLSDHVKTQQKLFVANVNNQVVERHMVRGLDKIFSPLEVNAMMDEEVLKIVAEPSSVKRKRDFLQDRKDKLQNGQDIFREVMGSLS